MKRITLAGLAMFCQALGAHALGQDARHFPQRPVQIVAGVAGASSDVIARAVREELASIWRKPVVVSNEADLRSGLRRITDSRPDGHTLLSSGTPLMLLWAQRLDLQEDPRIGMKDLLAGISAIAYSPQILAAHPGLGTKNLAEWLAAAREHPGRLRLGASGVSGLSWNTSRLLAARSGTQYNMITFAGGTPAVLAALLEGRLDAAVLTMAAATEHVRAGRLIPIAVTARGRAKALPGVPTLGEQGIDDVDTGTWLGLMAPAKTSRPVIDRIYKDILSTLTMPQVNHFLDSEGFTIQGIPPADTDRLIASEIARFRQVIKAAQ